jgi:hypothetical protein
VGTSSLALAVAVIAVGAAAGCGAGGEVADSDIVKALKLEPSPDRPVYAIGGDPFCEVSDDLLNDSDEVDAARGGDKLGLVITNTEQDVGVEGVPPFDPDCARKAKKELNRLE